MERLAARDATSVNAVAARELAAVTRRWDNPALLGALPDHDVDTAPTPLSSGADRAEHRLQAVERERTEAAEAAVLGAVEVRGAGREEPAGAGRVVERVGLLLIVRGVEHLDAVQAG